MRGGAMVPGRVAPPGGPPLAAGTRVSVTWRSPDGCLFVARRTRGVSTVQSVDNDKDGGPPMTSMKTVVARLSICAMLALGACGGRPTGAGGSAVGTIDVALQLAPGVT